MKQNYSVKGMTCAGCSATVREALEAHPEVMAADVSHETGQAVLTTSSPVSVAELQHQLGHQGKYSIHDVAAAPVADTPSVDPQARTGGWSSYKPLILIFLFIGGVTTIVTWENGRIDTTLWMRYFMAGFFLVFSFFKLLDLRGFADSYTMYDLLARRVRAYAFTYPFIELALGLAYLTNFEPQTTYLATIIVMGFSSIGVISSVLNKRKIRCACLGAVFNLPMSTVTIVEDLLMVAMAGYMLWML